MLDKFYSGYALLFAKPIFIKWNKFLYNLSIRGLGVLNYKTEDLRGEKSWLKNYLINIKQPFIIDVGANVGNYTQDIISINSMSKIISFEPHPSTFKVLKDNVSSFKSVEIVNSGVGATGGILELFDYKNNDGSSHASLYKDVIVDLHKKEVVSHKVSIIKLDDVLENKSEIIDLLKIDTEGNELNVLLGAKNLLDNNRINAIHFEFNEMNIISKTTFKDFWDLLSGNFNFYRILPFGKLLHIKNYSPISCEIYHYQNIVCIKKII